MDESGAAMRLIIGLLVCLVCFAVPAGRAAPIWTQPRAGPVAGHTRMPAAGVDPLRHVHPAAPAVRAFASIGRALSGTGLPIVLDGPVTPELFDPDP